MIKKVISPNGTIREAAQQMFKGNFRMSPWARVIA